MTRPKPSREKGGTEKKWSVKEVRRLMSGEGVEGEGVIVVRKVEGSRGGSGWEEVVKVRERGRFRKDEVEDLWTEDEGQGVFWLRVTSSAMEKGGKGDAEAVRVLVMLYDEDWYVEGENSSESKQ